LERGEDRGKGVTPEHHGESDMRRRKGRMSETLGKWAYGEKELPGCKDVSQSALRR